MGTVSQEETSAWVSWHGEGVETFFFYGYKSRFCFVELLFWLSAALGPLCAQERPGFGPVGSVCQPWVTAPWVPSVFSFATASRKRKVTTYSINPSGSASSWSLAPCAAVPFGPGPWPGGTPGLTSVCCGRRSPGRLRGRELPGRVCSLAQDLGCSPCPLHQLARPQVCPAGQGSAGVRSWAGLSWTRIVRRGSQGPFPPISGRFQ